jgi:outer membrane protein assembly factor BamA
MIMKQLGCVIAVVLCGFAAVGQVTNAPATATNAPSLFKSSEDGWFDVSGFLDEKYGFLPIAMPITEPAVGYGAGGGLTFISSPLGGETKEGYHRPNISAVGGFGTENGTWGAFAGDLRYWFDDRLQTLAGVMYASVNLDFYGIGDDPALAGRSLSYNLEPVGGMLQTKYRIGGSRVWAGLSYAFASTEVSFDAPPATPGVPSFRSESNVGGVTPSVTYDSRDTIFTPTRGTYVEAQAGLFSQALGSDDDFQRAQVIAMHFLPLSDRLFLGVRGQFSASFDDTPFYLRPFINLRGAPAMRYQGEAMAQIEGELRWQFWERFSAVGFVGTGTAWNDFENYDSSQSIVTGGTGFRYELARKYGIHAGMDVAFGPDNTAIYIQVGSAWMRP